jgi:hypothetical protein
VAQFLLRTPWSIYLHFSYAQAILILHLDIDEGNWLALRSARFFPRKWTPSVRTEYEAGSALQPAWTVWRINKFIAPTGIRNPDHPARSLVSILTTISRPQYQEGRYHNHWNVYAENPTEITVWSKVFPLH